MFVSSKSNRQIFKCWGEKKCVNIWTNLLDCRINLILINSKDLKINNNFFVTVTTKTTPTHFFAWLFLKSQCEVSKIYHQCPRSHFAKKEHLAEFVPIHTQVFDQKSWKIPWHYPFLAEQKRKNNKKHFFQSVLNWPILYHFAIFSLNL